jgi:hypothetical protein
MKPIFIALGAFIALAVLVMLFLLFWPQKGH